VPSQDPPRRIPSFALSGAEPLGVAKTPRPVSAYQGRDGYQSDFLGVPVPLPALRPSLRGDAALVKGGGIELRYRHFSVVQSKRRRLCWFSACNLDGGSTRKVARSDTWRFDPRLDLRYQILEECYGSARQGLFSRGHMTRREDPVWGAPAREAEEDTFHAPNAVPQMQSYNSPVWLGLEDHVLKNADRDDQKVVVITGPVLAPRDPVLYGVRVPVQFWKVVAFLQPGSKRLAAVGYLDSQAGMLPRPGPEFVWGRYQGMQVPLARLEKLTGLRFGPLTGADVLAGAGPTFALAVGEAKDVLLR